MKNWDRDSVRRLRSVLNLSQEQLADRLAVSYATVNRWESGKSVPQRAQRDALLALDGERPAELAMGETVAGGLRKRRGVLRSSVLSTKPMEQMLWDAACSIRGEKDAAKFKDFLLPMLFLKRLSDVFDDEIIRLTDSFGSHEKALAMAELDHSLVRFFLPAVARWGIVSGRESFEWPAGERPRDVGEHLTKAVRAVAKQNPTLSGVIDIEDFAAERNGERDINPAKLRSVIETFSDPRYRLGLADVEPDFLGRCYEYLLRKFAEDSGQSAGEFFTPTNVGFLIARIMRPKPGEECHDYACGSAGLLIKLQLMARELDPRSRVPLKLYGQELQAESFAVAEMNGIIHDMDVKVARGDSMINPKFRNSDGSLRRFDVVVANPMWNQPFTSQIFDDDPFDRFSRQGGVTSGRGDWAWLQHTLACMNDGGRAAVVLDTGAITRGSGSKNEDRERNIRKWFVDNDLIEGVILLPDNLFYNTPAAGVIVVLNKRKSRERKDNIILVNASLRFEKGRPKNYLSDDAVQIIASAFLSGKPVEGEVEVISRKQAESIDYSLSPSRWVHNGNVGTVEGAASLIRRLRELCVEESELDARLMQVVALLSEEGTNASSP